MKKFKIKTSRLQVINDIKIKTSRLQEFQVINDLKIFKTKEFKTSSFESLPNLSWKKFNELIIFNYSYLRNF